MLVQIIFLLTATIYYVDGIGKVISAYATASELREFVKSDLFVDKSPSIQYFFDEMRCSIPPTIEVLATEGMGKTANLNMMKLFFQASTDQMGNIRPPNSTEFHSIFQGLKIGQNQSFFHQHFGQYPVIHVNLADFGIHNSKEKFQSSFRHVVAKLVKDHVFLLRCNNASNRNMPNNNHGNHMDASFDNAVFRFDRKSAKKVQDRHHGGNHGNHMDVFFGNTNSSFGGGLSKSILDHHQDSNHGNRMDVSFVNSNFRFDRDSVKSVPDHDDDGNHGNHMGAYFCDAVFRFGEESTERVRDHHHDGSHGNYADISFGDVNTRFGGELAKRLRGHHNKPCIVFLDNIHAPRISSTKPDALGGFTQTQLNYFEVQRFVENLLLDNILAAFSTGLPPPPFWSWESVFRPETDFTFMYASENPEISRFYGFSEDEARLLFSRNHIPLSEMDNLRDKCKLRESLNRTIFQTRSTIEFVLSKKA